MTYNVSSGTLSLYTAAAAYLLIQIFVLKLNETNNEIEDE